MSQEAQIKRIAENLGRIADAMEAQNKLLNDLTIYPAEVSEPPRILIGIANAVITHEV